MNTLYTVMVCIGLAACDHASSIKTKPPLKALADGTMAVDTAQGGKFEITVLPLDKSAWGETNDKAKNTSSIEIEIDGAVRISVSDAQVIRIQGLQMGRHSFVEYIDGSKASSFHVDGSSHARLVADYYETYGTWIIREPHDAK